MALAQKEDEQDFQQMWIEAQNRFKKTTKKSLDQRNNRSLDDVLRELDKRFNTDDAQEGGAQHRVKELASNVLTFIELLGGIAAQGASIVFGPANLCFNAMQFLIDIPAKVSKFHEGLALLFEKISTFMKQFKVYQRIEQYAKVDVELKQSTHKLLIAFVDICGLSIDAVSGSKLKKMWTVAKIALFEDDSGVQEKLKEFQMLIDHQSQISDAVTLEHVVKTEHILSDMRKALDDSTQLLTENSLKTDIVVKYVNNSAGQKEQQDQSERICKKLSNSPLSIKETIQRLERDSEQMGHEMLSGTGSWLEDIVSYNRWTDLESETSSLLYLSGENGSGKSCLALHVLNSFKDRYSLSISEHSTADTNPLRVASAFYRFVKNEQLPREDAIKYSLKCMAAQIAKQSTVYSKKLDSQLKSRDVSIFKDMDVKELSEELLLTPKIKDTTDTAYVLLFDGVDQLSDDDASQLLAATVAMNSSKVRIVITGTETTFNSCMKILSEQSLDFPIIRVADYNEVDIKSFINSELKTYPVLQRDVPGISKIVGSIQKKLPEIANGSFNGVRQILDKVSKSIESACSEDQILALISEDTLENERGAAKRIVNELNGSLNSQEIEQLNELLAWTIYAFGSIGVKTMRAALFLRTQKRPLQSLEDKVAQKYSGIIKYEPDYDWFEIRNAQMEAFFMNSRRETKRLDVQGNDNPKISMKIEIDHVDLSTVQRFFWDLSEKVVLEKFVFTKSQTEAAQNVKISASPTEGHLALTRRCFDLLLEKPSDETEHLGRYALPNLPMHLSFLRENLDNDPLDTAEREEIVEYLVSLLQSVERIDSHLTVGFFSFGSWLDVDGVNAIHAWLCDSKATGKLNRKGRSWLGQMISGGKLKALKDIAIMVARHWLCYRTWSAELPFQWIDAYLDQVEREGGPGQIAGESKSGGDASGDSIDNSRKGAETIRTRVSRAVKWTENEAGITGNSLSYERLGDTYLNFREIGVSTEEIRLSKEETALSIEAYSTAKKHPNSSWKVSEGLANAYAKSGKKNSAVEEMESVFLNLRNKEGMTPDEKASLVRDLIISAKWQVELHNTDDAVGKLREAIHLDEHHYLGYYELLKVYVDTDQGSEALRVLNEMRTESAKDTKLTRLEAMFMEFLEWEEDKSLVYFEKVFHVTRHNDMFKVILQTLEGRLTSARETNAISNLIKLLLCHGVALAHYSAEEKGLEAALTHWTECCKLTAQCESWEDCSSVLSAATYVLNYHFSQAESPSSPSNSFETRVAELTGFMGDLPDTFTFGQPFHQLLGGFYNLMGKQDTVQKLLLNDIKTGIDLLSDDDPENDFIGYDMMGNVLLHTADELNALSAWYLYGSSLSQVRYGPYLSCDGCNRYIPVENAYWSCKVCYNTGFDDECMENLRSGTLDHYVCSRDHQWLRIPSWVEEFKATGKGRVRVGGEFKDGKRIGGQIVAVEEWLDMIREKWGIEKPTPVVQTEQKKPEDQTAS